jgi:hypothetical protein
LSICLALRIVRSSGASGKEELMVQRLSVTELVTGILLLAALTSAAVQLGPTALERWL